MYSLKILIFGLSVTLFSNLKADYSCKAYGEDTKLKITENYPTRIGDTKVELISKDNKSTYYGIMKTHIDHFVEKKIISLVYNGGLLTISENAFYCGRAFCDHNHSHLIQGKLDIQGQDGVYFICDK